MTFYKNGADITIWRGYIYDASGGKEAKGHVGLAMAYVNAGDAISIGWSGTSGTQSRAIYLLTY